MRQPRPTRIEEFRRAARGPVDPRRSTVARSRRPSVRGRLHVVGFAAWCTVTVMGFCAIAGFGLPTIRPDWDLPVLVGGAGTVAAGFFGARRSAVGRPLRSVRVTVAVAATLSALFALGLSTQLVLDERPRLAVSDEARAHDIVGELYADILVLQDADELIGYEQADARARYNDYEPTISVLRSIANRWSRTDLGALPDPDLIDVVQGVKVAATFGAEALDIRFRLIVEPDERGEQALVENRAALFDATLTAAAGLKPLAERYQVDIGAGRRGE